MQSVIGGLQSKTPRGTEMEAVTHRDQAGTEAPSTLDSDFDCLVTGEMAERVMRIENDSCAFVRDDFPGLFHRDRPFPDPVQIHFDQHYAVRGLALKIGIHQSPGDRSCRSVGEHRPR